MREPKETLSHFAIRTHCSNAHYVAARQARQAALRALRPTCDLCGGVLPRLAMATVHARCQLNQIIPLITSEYPGAAYATVADLPAACPRCGGMLTRRPDGMGCLLCGRALIVAELLDHMIGRGVVLEGA